MLRVYHFILDHRIGGPHVYATSIAGALQEMVESIIVTTNQGTLTDIPLVNLRHLWKPFYVIELPINVFLIIWMVLSGRISRINSIFHVHQAANIAPILSACLLRIPVVWQFHETVPGFRILVRIGLMCLKYSRHRLLAVAHECKKIYRVPQAEVLPAIVDPEFWCSDKGVNLNLVDSVQKEGVFKIVAVGNINPLKGFDVLLDALAQFPGDWVLYIAGPELETFVGYAQNLKEKQSHILKNNRNQKIKFLGWQSREEVRQILASCNVFVLPSLSEACPIALLEAMAMEKVCIATRVGDVPLILGNGALGLLVEPNDIDGLAKVLLEARKLSDESVRRLGESARRQVINFYSLGPVSKKVLKVYENLLDY